MSASRTHKVTPSAPMPRAARNFTLSFGLLNVGVAWTTLFREDATPKAHFSCPEHNGPVKQAWYCEHGDHYVDRNDLEKAFEYAGQQIVLGDSEVKTLESEHDGIVALKQSCAVEAIDPSYYEKSYLLWPTPGKNNEAAFRALLTAMRDTGLALVGQGVVSKTDRAMVVRWSHEHGTLIAHVCNYGANVKQDAVDLVNAGEQAWAEPDEALIGQARMLLSALEGEFDPHAVENTYAGRLENALATKLNGGIIELEDDPIEGEAPVPDLMAAMKAMVAEVQARKSGAVV